MTPSGDGSRRPAKPAKVRFDLDAIEWFYRQKGRTYGPMTSLDLRAAARLGFLDPGDEVLRCGQGTLVSAGSAIGF